MNWKWPKTATNNMRPWYDIVWRLPGAAILALGRAICVIGALLAFGPRAALGEWDR